MYSNKFTYSKKEKLCSRKVITSLFENGKAFYSEPFRVLWLKSESINSFPALSAISVGKKSFARAVDRNRLKRLIREAWRINKKHLYDELEKLDMQIVMMIIYIGDKKFDYKDIEAQMRHLVRRFALHLKTISENNLS
ncbi:MAG: ribonuclease P protein component [Bacteroidales bacterium]|nr:ribonuclease P protein component [Bacteroidales bacterium]